MNASVYQSRNKQKPTDFERAQNTLTHCTYIWRKKKLSQICCCCSSTFFAYVQNRHNLVYLERLGHNRQRTVHLKHIKIITHTRNAGKRTQNTRNAAAAAKVPIRRQARRTRKEAEKTCNIDHLWAAIQLSCQNWELPFELKLGQMVRGRKQLTDEEWRQ